MSIRFPQSSKVAVGSVAFSIENSDRQAVLAIWHDYCLYKSSFARHSCSEHDPLMSSEYFIMDLIQNLPVGAIEYSLLYMLGGGGLIGALVIFAIAKMLRR